MTEPPLGSSPSQAADVQPSSLAAPPSASPFEVHEAVTRFRGPTTVGLWLRSLVFNAVLFTTMTLILITYLPLLAGPPKVLRRAVRAWVKLVDASLRGIIGLSWRIEGREHMPVAPAILACKHQSTWETFFFFLLFPEASYVLKKELLSIPLWGWYAQRSGVVVVDRSAGARALKRMISDGRRLVAAGRTLVVFPEGTRTQPGARPPLMPGVAALASRLDAPVVPVALNSGVFWGRRAFLKYPGTITVRFLPHLPDDLPKPQFLSELQDRIDDASDDLARNPDRS